MTKLSVLMRGKGAARCIDIEPVSDDIGMAVVKLMAARNVKAKYVLLGWETALLLAHQWGLPLVPDVIFTPVGEVKVLVDHEVARGVRALAGVGDALVLAGLL